MKSKCDCEKWLGVKAEHGKDPDFPAKLFNQEYIDKPLIQLESDFPERIRGTLLECRKCGTRYEYLKRYFVDKHIPEGLIVI